MRIGTPMSPTATRVMLLGAGELGKEVIIALQRFGDSDLRPRRGDVGKRALDLQRVANAGEHVGNGVGHHGTTYLTK